ncbi:solute:sodium symporter family transporter [Paenactinomyces guangxiensis]|uniref:Solute:sodium symporter family transporter n=1 Tax=Paenactinomyces guangxiensis TaxID=1490290 RepID=A0A7W1WP31_9BACL|nr:solute:sodium symporter family transporter [Paenactinomyces guangxiensis]MBA4493447.1 solute:sodium symporter family transporter [Paenactinomyces guangxiensis]MBH8590538.1 solute:sodium symporter family transporter [Paenactinomyces guangxiensis]
MEHTNLLFTLLSCIFFMGLIAWISYLKTKGHASDTKGYFLAGRGLTGIFIAGALLLTNLSAEQLIGLNGQAYRSNLTNMAWEVTAAFSVIIMALYLLPKYLGGAFTTLPEFLSSRYGEGVRRYTVVLFMLGYILVTIPSTLYSGALSILKLFDVPELFGISYEHSVWLLVWIIGISGGVLAIFGGAKAVATSDTLYGIGLLIVGLLVPVLGFIALGKGDIVSGMKYIVEHNPEKLNAIGSAKDSVPFGTIFTGMIFANLFYWGTNQYVIQRALGAKNLAEGQKGVLFTGFFKLLIPLFMMIPGIISFHLYGPGMDPVDLAYPALVAKLLPKYLLGFFLAVLLGAVFSSFNALINSASTMFTIDIYKQQINPNADDKRLVKVSKIFGTAIAFVSFFVSPLLMNAPEGLWDLIRRFTGFFNIPIITIVLVGIFSRYIPEIAAKVVIVFHVIAYYMLVWGLEQIFGYKLDIHFIHIYAILFVVEVAIMMVIGKIRPRKEPYVYKVNSGVEMIPWKYSIATAVVLFSLVVMMYVFFSPIGLAYGKGYVSSLFWPVMIAIVTITAIALYFSVTRWNKKYADSLRKQHSKIVRDEKMVI